jgi:hypothetical protein
MIGQRGPAEVGPRRRWSGANVPFTVDSTPNNYEHHLQTFIGPPDR